MICSMWSNTEDIMIITKDGEVWQKCKL